MKKIFESNKHSRQLVVTLVSAVWAIYLLSQSYYFQFYIIAIMYFIQMVFYRNSISMKYRFRHLPIMLSLVLGYLLVYGVLRKDYLSETLVPNRVFDYSTILIIIVLFFIFIFTVSNDLIKSDKKK